MTEYRYSERGCIRQGDTFRARGGPTYRGSRVGAPGLYRLLSVETDSHGINLVAVAVDRHGLQKGGVNTLLVSGKPYRLPQLPEWIVRPYRVARKRS